MAGEMSQSEVTRESYPLLFELRDKLKAKGIKSGPRAFDQYQGPYLRVNGLAVWYDEYGEHLIIERGFYLGHPGTFETKGADRVFKATSQSVKYGIYNIHSAVDRIALIVR